MLQLNLFGDASIRADGAPVTGRAAHGRRLALLTLLACARGRPLKRDRIIPLFWPDASPDHARRILSHDVYIIRSALGDAVLRSAGDELSLDRAAITSDVDSFEQLLEAGRPEAAVELVAGPLLDGFHLNDGGEFERWLDGERARLGRRYATALQSLAEGSEARQDFAGAAVWWRRLAAHDPLDGTVALGLMRALAAAGDRGGALRHARLHAILMREEFDADPDPAVGALAEQLRAEPSGAPAEHAGAERPRASPAPPAPDLTQAAATPTTAERAPAAAEPALAAAAPARRRRMRAAAAAAALVLLMAVAALYALRGRAAPAVPRSVAVLPFVNMSPDPGNSYFSDGLSEQIILALSRIEGLHVAARTSSFALRHRELDVRAIADTLGVHAVLEGSVLVDGERLRVIAQLIDARTGYHLWSEQYDGALRDALAVQDRIATAIAGALHLRLAGASPLTATSNAQALQAYDLYLRALYLRNTQSRDQMQQALEYLDSAIAIEPGFALAYAAKASVVAPLAYYRHAGRDSVVDEVRRLTARALELDASIGEAHASLGLLKLFFDWDWAGAEAALRRALELNPNDAHAWHHLANYHAAMGSPHAARDARERAVQLDPLNPRTSFQLAKDYLVTHELERALEHGRRAAQLDPSHPQMLGRGPELPTGPGEALLWLGRPAEALEEYVRLAALRGATPDEMQAMRAAYAAAGMPGFWKRWLALDLRQSGPSPDPLRIAATHMMIGDTTLAFDWLDRAYDERNPGLIFLYREPVFQGLHTHPRLVRVARAVGLPD